MNKMDFKMPLGAFIHLLAVVWISVNPHYDGLFVWMLPFLLMNIAGLLLVFANQARLGAIIFIVGCVPFVPVGVIGIFGAKKVLQGLNEAVPNNA